jgi:hypothetical protein
MLELMKITSIIFYGWILSDDNGRHVKKCTIEDCIKKSTRKLLLAFLRCVVGADLSVPGAFSSARLVYVLSAVATSSFAAAST